MQHGGALRLKKLNRFRKRFRDNNKRETAEGKTYAIIMENPDIRLRNATPSYKNYL